MNYEAQKRGPRPKDEPFISKIDQVMALFLVQCNTKSHYLNIFESLYLVRFLRYRPQF